MRALALALGAAAAPRLARPACGEGCRMEPQHEAVVGAVLILLSGAFCAAWVTVYEFVKERRTTPVLCTEAEDAKPLARDDGCTLAEWREWGARPVGPGATCPICLGDMALEDRVCGLDCGHVYHEPCLRGWLAAAPRPRCPLCRGDVTWA